MILKEPNHDPEAFSKGLPRIHGEMVVGGFYLNQLASFATSLGSPLDNFRRAEAILQV